MNAGGLETMLMNLYRNIDRDSIQFDFLVQYPDKGFYDDEIISLGGRIHYVPSIRKTGPFRYEHNLRMFFNNNSDYSIVHSHINMMSGIVLKIAKRAGIIKTISHSHFAYQNYPIIEKLFKRYAASYLDKYADYAFACSKAAGKCLYGNCPRLRNSFKIVPNAIDMNKYFAAETLRSIIRHECACDDSFVIGHIGRFVPEKNHDHLIRVFSQAVKHHPQSKLFLIGDGPLRSTIEKLVRAEGLEQAVYFWGIRNDVHRLLQSFDVMLLPSFMEGLPVVLIEAQAAGVPCIISNVITSEVDLGLGLIETIAGYSTQDWLQRIDTLRNAKTRMPSQVERERRLRDRGYDVIESADQLRKFYLEGFGCAT